MIKATRLACLSFGHDHFLSYVDLRSEEAVNNQQRFNASVSLQCLE